MPVKPTQARIDELTRQRDEALTKLAAERERCADIIDNLRNSEARNFKDPKYQGQRGADRLDALYDAYCAVKNGMGE